MAMSAAAVLLMASCSKDQVTHENPGNAIRLKAFTTASSKATATENTDVLDFTAVAYDNSSAIYFSDTYSRNSGTAAFVAESGTHYWPTSGNLTFIGHSPADLTGYMFSEPTVNTDALGTAKISAINPNQRADQQVDLLIYRNQGNGTDNANGLALQMHHALSRIIVQAQNENPNMKVEVIGVKLGRLKSKADLSYPADNTEAGTLLASSLWSFGSYAEFRSYIAGAKVNEAGNAFTTSAQTVAVKTAADAEGFEPTNLMFGEESFMVIPQEVTPWNGNANDANGAYIAVLCRISSDNGSGNLTQLFPDGADKYAYSAVPIPASTTWQPGYQYTYTLRFFADGTGGGGTVPPTDTTEPVPTDPTNPGVDTTPQPGEPVVGGAITLTVNVEAWNTTTADIETEMGGDPATASTSQVRQ